jgi:hypothetical protein
MSVIKKQLSLVLVLCLLLSCSAVVFAEETAALSVKILSAPKIEEGMAIADAQVEFELSEGYLGETVWMAWGVEHNEDMGDYETYIPAEGTFNANDVYYLQLKITAKEGYTLPEDFNYESAVNPDYLGYSTEYDENDNVISYTIDLGVFSLSTKIDTVEVVFAPVEVGGTPGVESMTLYVGETALPADSANLSAVWYSLLDDYEEMTGVFEDKKVYQVQGEIQAPAGYRFSDDTVVYINGEETVGFSYPNRMEIFKEFSLRDHLPSFVISGMPQAKEGVNFRDALVLESEYEGCELMVYWMDEAWEEVEEDAFLAGKTYILQIEAMSTSYEKLFEEFVFVIDGKTYLPTYLSENQALLELTISVPAAGDQEIPSTGDPFMPLLWMVLAVLSLAGTVVLAKTRH